MTLDTRLTVALAVALPLPLIAWTQITRHTAMIVAAGLVMLLILAVGWGARRLRASALVVIAAEIVALAAATLTALAALHGLDSLGSLLHLPSAGLAFLESGAPPVSAHAGASLLLVGGAGLMALTADAVAITARYPAGAIAPLVALHLVPALGLSTPTPFGEFVALALGIVLVLWAASPTAASERVRTRAFAAGSVAVMTLAALGLTWTAAQFVPPFEAPRALEPLQMNDPSLDLKRNLVQGSDDSVLRYTTDAPTGTYLKLATLPALSANGFALSDVRVATGRLPSPPGNPSGTRRTTTVQILGFSSEWLPVPYAPRVVDAPGSWGFAVNTLDVMALAGPTRTSATDGITYTVESVEITPDAASIAAATSDGGDDRELTLALPSGLPDSIRTLAADLTADAPTAGAKAQALTEWLRSDAFTYSTASAAGVGDSLATIEHFLVSSRTGYCEQFAGSLAILARTVGIPSRIAVGFAPGTQSGDGWDVTAHDMHAWPELWLDGLGWVAFEPTPATGRSDAPPPTPSASAAAPAASASAAPATASPAPATAMPEEEETPAPAEATAEPTPSAPAESDADVSESADPLPAWWPWVIGVLVIGAAVGAAFLAPRILRQRRRAQRLAGSGDAVADTLAAWDEVRETASDARIPWPDGSPRFAAERLVASLGADAAAVDALRALAAACERALYDRRENFADPGAWAEAVTIINAALLGEAETKTRRGKAEPRRAAR